MKYFLILVNYKCIHHRFSYILAFSPKHAWNVQKIKKMYEMIILYVFIGGVSCIVLTRYILFNYAINNWAFWAILRKSFIINIIFLYLSVHISLIFPDQLFRNNPSISKSRKIFMFENFDIQNIKPHKQKILLHLLSMKNYKSFIEKLGYSVELIDYKTISKKDFYELFII